MSITRAPIVAKASLFDPFTRVDCTYKKATESDYGYLNRSSRQDVTEARLRLDLWFNEYPIEHRNQLSTKFKNVEHHHGAFWELFLHHWATQQRYLPEVNTGTPDFWLTIEKQRVALEATAINEPPKIPDEKLEVLNSVLSGLTSTTHDLAFDIDDDDQNRFCGSFGSRDSNAVGQWVKQLPIPIPNPQATWINYVRPLRRNGMIFHAHPTRVSDGNERHGFIQAPYMLSECRTHERIHKAIRSKAKKLSKDFPSIVAINIVSDPLFEHDDVENALFGMEGIRISKTSASPKVQGQPVRVGSGAFGKISNPANTRISGILIANRLSALSTFPSMLHLYERTQGSLIPELLGETCEQIVAWGEIEYRRRAICVEERI